MKPIMLFSSVFALVIAVLLACSAVAQAPSVSKTNNYAEGLYAEFAAGAGSEVSFQITTLDRGPLTSIQGIPFNSLLSAPPFRLETDDHGTDLLNAHFAVPETPSYNLHDMGYSVDKFQSIGYPVSAGSYRRLNVAGTVGNDTRQWQALEFCWPELGHCAVLDPAVVFLQSKVDNRLRLRADGWGPRLSLGGEGKGVMSPSGTCGLSSHHGWTYEAITWNAYTVKYKNIFGFTLVSKSLGMQQVGLSCTVSCNPAPFSTSNSSSAWGNSGYTTACANTGGATGTTGATGRSIAQTKCTHQWVQQASASVTIAGSGASISANWTLAGGVDSNGGTLTDTCGYF